MARTASLASMDVEELLKLRDNISSVLSQKTAELKRQLQRLDGESWTPSQSNGVRRGRTLKGRKLPAKYRDPKNPSNVWAGRGALPRWMQERIAAGAKKEHFLIAAGGNARKQRFAKTSKRSRAKRSRGRKKAA